MLELKERIDETACTAKKIAATGVDHARAVAQAASIRAKVAASGLIDAMKETAQDAAVGASELVGTATDKAQEWASSVGDAAVHAKDRAQRLASATVEKAADLGKDVTALIRRYPIPALLIGVGAGFLLGQVLHHSSSKRA